MDRRAAVVVTVDGAELEHATSEELRSSTAADARRLAEAARAAGPDTFVPGCPGWTVAHLVRHVGSVHYRASLIIGQRRDRAPLPSETAAPPGDPFAWYEQGSAALLRTIHSADRAATYWTFRGPNPLQWWLRRLASETLVHRVDAEQAAGRLSVIDRRSAADGIAEHLDTYLPVVALRRLVSRRLTIGLNPIDVDGSWTVTLGHGADMGSGAGLGQYLGGETAIRSLIIDEGFGSLDADGRQRMIEELRALSEHLDRIIVVSHQEDFTDRTLFPNGFVLRKDGTKTVVERVG